MSSYLLCFGSIRPCMTSGLGSLALHYKLDVPLLCRWASNTVVIHRLMSRKDVSLRTSGEIVVVA